MKFLNVFWLVIYILMKDYFFLNKYLHKNIFFNALERYFLNNNNKIIILLQYFYVKNDQLFFESIAMPSSCRDKILPAKIENTKRRRKTNIKNEILAFKYDLQ